MRLVRRTEKLAEEIERQAVRGEQSYLLTGVCELLLESFAREVRNKALDEASKIGEQFEIDNEVSSRILALKESKP